MSLPSIFYIYNSNIIHLSCYCQSVLQLALIQALLYEILQCEVRVVLNHISACLWVNLSYFVPNKFHFNHYYSFYIMYLPFVGTAYRP